MSLRKIKMNKIINYNDISKNYSIHRNSSCEVITHILQLLNNKKIETILEVGCGTADYLFSLGQNIKSQLFGFDNSEGMVKEGNIKNPGLILTVNDVHNKFNYNNDFFDFVYSIDVIHYVKDLDHCFNESFRVLKKDGIIMTITDSEEDLKNRTMTKYFPKSLQIEMKRYHKIKTIKESMERNGFKEIEISHTEKEYEIDEKLFQKFKNKAYSAIRLISDKSFDEGIKKLEEDMKKNKCKINELYTYIKGTK